MESLNDTKKRIRSVKNTRQITKAMEVVSATKMRKSQERALKARGYAFAAFELLANLERVIKNLPAGRQGQALFIRPEGKKTLLIVITSDKGLAGSLNSNVLKRAYAWYKKESGDSPFPKGSTPEAGGISEANPPAGLPATSFTNGGIDVIVAGKKARDFFKFRKVPLANVFFGHGDFADFEEVNNLSAEVKGAFLTGQYHRVVAIYTNFRSTLKQEAVIREVLPLKDESLREFITGLAPERGKYSETTNYELRTTSYPDYLFEPSPDRVFRELTERLFQMIIYHIILEANASEHSARMVAMKTASENAAEIVDDLTLLYNKGRQAKITQELVEITSGSDAVA